MGVTPKNIPQTPNSVLSLCAPLYIAKQAPLHVPLHAPLRKAVPVLKIITLQVCFDFPNTELSNTCFVCGNVLNSKLNIVFYFERLETEMKSKRSRLDRIFDKFDFKSSIDFKSSENRSDTETLDTR